MGLEFFKPEDFEGPAALNRWVKHGSYEYTEILKFVSERANQKLESEGKVVTGFYDDPNSGKHPQYESWLFTDKSKPRDSHKALLINIEPIEKCTHPAEKIRQMNWSEPVEGFNRGFRVTMDAIFQCECGAKVKPKSFEVCE